MRHHKFVTLKTSSNAIKLSNQPLQSLHEVSADPAPNRGGDSVCLFLIFKEQQQYFRFKIFQQLYTKNDNACLQVHSSIYTCRKKIFNTLKKEYIPSRFLKRDGDWAGRITLLI